MEQGYFLQYYETSLRRLQRHRERERERERERSERRTDRGKRSREGDGFFSTTHRHRQWSSHLPCRVRSQTTSTTLPFLCFVFFLFFLFSLPKSLQVLSWTSNFLFLHSPDAFVLGFAWIIMLVESCGRMGFVCVWVCSSGRVRACMLGVWMFMYTCMRVYVCVCVCVRVCVCMHACMYATFVCTCMYVFKLEFERVRV
jgi:hypothetical protein